MMCAGAQIGTRYASRMLHPRCGDFNRCGMLYPHAAPEVWCGDFNRCGMLYPHAAPEVWCGDFNRCGMLYPHAAPEVWCGDFISVACCIVCVVTLAFFCQVVCVCAVLSVFYVLYVSVFDCECVQCLCL